MNKKLDELMGMVRAGKILMSEGSWSTELYWLKSGTMKAYVGDKVVREFSPGDLIGEFSFLDQRPRSATVKAVSDCELIKLERKHFEEMLTELNPWMKKILETLLKKVREEG